MNPMEKKAKIFISMVSVLILVVILLAVMRGDGGESSDVPGKYDALATCLAEKGAVFYGAFWCSHCQDQKKMFGSSAKLLPYVECSTLDGRGQLEECRVKGIEGYPTWEFADGSRLGKSDVATLAEKTGCELPPENI